MLIAKDITCNSIGKVNQIFKQGEKMKTRLNYLLALLILATALYVPMFGEVIWS
jgi:hypothetical protein